MMAFELVSDRPTASRQHVFIDGQRHILIELDTLERLGFDARASIAYPPVVPGWATMPIGPTRYAAWFERGPS